MNHEIADLRLQIARLNRAIEQRPYRFQTGSTLNLLEIIDGQTVYNVGGTIYYGIIPAAVLATVTTAYDPDISVTPGAFTAQNGIGRAYLWSGGTRVETPVLVAHDTTGPIANALVQGDFVMTDQTASILVGAGPNAIIAYLLRFQ